MTTGSKASYLGKRGVPLLAIMPPQQDSALGSCPYCQYQKPPLEKPLKESLNYNRVLGARLRDFFKLREQSYDIMTISHNNGHKKIITFVENEKLVES